MKKRTIFLSFSLGQTSVSDFFLELAYNFSIENQVVIFSDRILPESIQIPKNTKIFYWPSTRPTKIKDAYFLFKNILRYKPAMVISNFGSVNIFTLISFICLVKHRIAWVHTISTQFDSKKVFRFRKSLVYKLCTNIVTNSFATKQDVIDVFNVNKKKIFVIYNSLNITNTPSSPTEIENITYVGRLHKSKGVTILLDAFAIVLKELPSLKLNFIGNGPELEMLKEQCRLLKIESNVNFLGSLSKAEVLCSFKKSFCAVIPSFSEAFGYTVIEAMSEKTCVIGANNTGIKEIIIDNETGLLFDTGNVKHLAS